MVFAILSTWYLTIDLGYQKLTDWPPKLNHPIRRLKRMRMCFFSVIQTRNWLLKIYFFPHKSLSDRIREAKVESRARRSCGADFGLSTSSALRMSRASNERRRDAYKLAFTRLTQSGTLPGSVYRAISIARPTSLSIGRTMRESRKNLLMIR